MKIAMINGSPKLGKSNSASALETLTSLIDSKHEITYYSINKNPLESEQYIDLCHMDTLVFAFPLYIDAIPSHLFRMLVTLENYIKKEKKGSIYVYVLLNNGFYEGHQNHIALEIMKNWCKRAGLFWGMGIGQGAGEMMGFIENVPFGHGPKKNFGKAIEIFINSIERQKENESMLFSPNFPYYAWRFSAKHLFLRREARKNGLKRKEIVRRIE